MNALSLFAVLSSAQAVSTAPTSQLTVEPPVEMHVQPVPLDRTVTEFIEMCVRPKWSISAFSTAVQNSDFAYIEDYRNDTGSSYSWKSKYAYLNVNVRPEWSQCALSIGSSEPVTGQQLLQKIKPLVEAELGRKVQENDANFYLDWVDESGDDNRIGLVKASAKPSQAIWYVFDKTAPGVRQKLEALMPATPASATQEPHVQ